MRLSRLLNIVGILPLLALSADAQVLVTNPADAGPGSLREAVATATVGDTILFAGPMTINLTSPIVVGVDGIVIEGCYPDVTLNASGLFPGIELNGVTGCKVRGLVLEGFNPALGLRGGANGNTIGGLNPCDRVEVHLGGMGVALSDPGTDANVFLNVKAHQNLHNGIYLRNGASYNEFGDGSSAGAVNSHNNGMNGVVLEDLTGAAVLQNQFNGCLIGTDMTGMAGTGNTLSGVVLDGVGVTDNIFRECVISGNGMSGVTIDGGASQNRIQGCLIGVDITGVNALPNVIGVLVLAGSSNWIEARCVISGNQQDGVLIRSSASYQNNILDSLLGPDALANALGNGASGAALLDGTWENKVEGNHISSNFGDGVLLAGNAPHDNYFDANLIGTDQLGVAAMQNYGHGVRIASVANDNYFKRNTMSGNAQCGVAILGQGCDRNVFQGNFVGVDAGLTVAIANGASGFFIRGSRNIVGGATPIEMNYICANTGWGVLVQGIFGSAAAMRNEVIGNTIGMSGLGNARGGVFLDSGAIENFVGGHSPSPLVMPGNNIWWNGGAGVLVENASSASDPADGNLILTNSISNNAGAGIELAGNGNCLIPAPLITAANSAGVSGYTTVASTPCLVQVFRDSNDEGFEFLGEFLVSSAYGSFSVPASLSAGDRVTATQTADLGCTTIQKETSAFSSVMTALEFGAPTCFCAPVIAPCGNPDSAAGCANSTGLGASLKAHGSGSVSNDNLTFSAERLPAGVFTMLISSKGGASIPFGDGVLCVSPGARIWRRGVTFSELSGATVYGDGLVAGSTLLAPGALISSGDAWTFQVLYRDLAGPCGTGRNLTNSVKVGFTP